VRDLAGVPDVAAAKALLSGLATLSLAA
jgi:hypothetical protein